MLNAQSKKIVMVYMTVHEQALSASIHSFYYILMSHLENITTNHSQQSFFLTLIDTYLHVQRKE